MQNNNKLLVLTPVNLHKASEVWIKIIGLKIIKINLFYKINIREPVPFKMRIPC